MAVKLHTCPNPWLPGPHPCNKVRKALREAGIEHEVVKEPLMRPKRQRVIDATGQQKLPAIEFEDGRWLREESGDLVTRIRDGRLFSPQS